MVTVLYQGMWGHARLLAKDPLTEEKAAIIVANFNHGGSARMLYDFFWAWKKDCVLTKEYQKSLYFFCAIALGIFNLNLFNYLSSVLPLKVRSFGQPQKTDLRTNDGAADFPTVEDFGVSIARTMGKVKTCWGPSAMSLNWYQQLFGVATPAQVWTADGLTYGLLVSPSCGFSQKSSSPLRVTYCRFLFPLVAGTVPPSHRLRFGSHCWWEVGFGYHCMVVYTDSKHDVNCSAG